MFVATTTVKVKLANPTDDAAEVEREVAAVAVRCKSGTKLVRFLVDMPELLPHLSGYAFKARVSTNADKATLGHDQCQAGPALEARDAAVYQDRHCWLGVDVEDDDATRAALYAKGRMDGDRPPDMAANTFIQKVLEAREAKQITIGQRSADWFVSRR